MDFSCLLIILLIKTGGRYEFGKCILLVNERFRFLWCWLGVDNNWQNIFKTQRWCKVIAFVANKMLRLDVVQTLCTISEYILLCKANNARSVFSLSLMYFFNLLLHLSEKNFCDWQQCHLAMEGWRWTGLPVGSETMVEEWQMDDTIEVKP